jgi:Tfp pilus assembly protein PilO
MSVATPLPAGLHGAPLLRRALHEHRRSVVPLAIALLINIVAYALIVYPLSRQVANVAQRDERAAAELRAARAEHTQARGTLTGKDQAARELTAFYRDVLPANIAAARRLVYLPLHRLARESGMRIERTSNEIVERRSGTLARVQTTMELAGSYSSMRSFIHQLETAPQFVVVDNVELSEDDSGGDLAVKLDLSTYIRTMP